MKELTIEEKAKRYDELKVKARQIYNKENDVLILHTIEDLFSELKESEDEKVKKSLIRLVKAFYDVNFPTPEGFSRKDLLDWLKKQGEQKFEQKFFINDKVVHKATGKIWTIHHYLKDTNSYYVEDNDGLLHHYRESELKLVEQKPAGNSGKKSEDVIEEKDMTEYKKGFECGKQCVLKYPEDYNLCKKIAWSEEDEEIHRKCICAMRASACGFPEEEKFVEQVNNWFKCLKERYTWKPSDEQMELIKDIVFKDRQKITRKELAIFHSIYNDLKKLREE